MGHWNTIRGNRYAGLARRLNRYPLGAPASELLFRILKLLFSEREAELASLLPIKPFSDKKAAEIWHLNLNDARKILNDLADRGILLDYEDNGTFTYTMVPPMAGFFEFSLMRYRNDIDQKTLSELLYQYLNVEEDFIKALFLGGETQLGRVFADESALTGGNALHVLDYERASEVIKTAAQIGVGVCYCRHKMKHVGKNCGAPLDICMTFNSPAASLIRHGIARKIDAAEGLDLLDKARGHNLVQFGENVRERVSFICNCCGCCCGLLAGVRRMGLRNAVAPTPYLLQVDEGRCSGCGACVRTCQIQAVELRGKKAQVLQERCLGCGACVRVCAGKALSLEERAVPPDTPKDSATKFVRIAREKGRLWPLLREGWRSKLRALG